MRFCARGWVGFGVPFARVGTPWRAGLCLYGNGGAVSWQRRGKSPDPLGVARQYQQWRKEEEELLGRRHKSVAAYLLAAVAGMVGLSYASVPLYRLFCQVSGFGGTIRTDQNSEKIETMKPIKDRVIKVTFNADVHATLSWNFRPQQTEIYVVPGETALAFYKAKNPTDQPIIGISTYNVVPFEAGPYFNKIQCFCFEEQRLNPHEEVDMPVFFYIDPAIDEDPVLMNVNLITLSYTFFESKTGAKLPLPGFMQQNII